MARLSVFYTQAVKMAVSTRASVALRMVEAYEIRYSSCDRTFTSSNAQVPLDRSKPLVAPPKKPSPARPSSVSGLSQGIAGFWNACDKIDELRS